MISGLWPGTKWLVDWEVDGATMNEDKVTSKQVPI